MKFHHEGNRARPQLVVVGIWAREEKRWNNPIFFIMLNVDILVNCSSVKKIRDILGELKRVKEF